MKVFQSLQKSMSVMGIQPPEPTQKYSFNWKSLFALIFLGKFSISTIAALWFEVKTFSEYAESFYTILTTLSVCLNFSVFISKMQKISESINGFEILIQKHLDENPASKRSFEQANEKFEKWTNIIYFVCVKVTVPAVMMPTFIISYFNYFTTDLGSEAFRLPFPEWIPFDTKTPLRFFMAVFVQFCSVFVMLHMLVYNLSFMIGSCWMFVTFAKEIKSEWMTAKKMENFQENQLEFKKRVHGYIEFHAAAKQSVRSFTDFYEITIASYFLWSLLTICGTLLLLQIELQLNGVSVRLIQPSVSIFWSFYPIFLFCELGEGVSNEFYELNDALYQSDWYLFPTETQRMLPMLLMATQQQVVPRGFGNLPCIRQASQKVANSGFSYFIVLRRFGY